MDSFAERNESIARSARCAHALFKSAALRTACFLQRTIVNRERAKRSYGVATFLSAKLLAELPISALFPLLFGALVYPLTGTYRPRGTQRVSTADLRRCGCGSTLPRRA